MKITLEFEEADLRQMITDHFTKEGFNVKNLDDICRQFLNAYPTGLKVEADILPQPAPAPVQTLGYVEAVPTDDVVTYTDEDAEEDVSREPEGVSLTLNDLMDPTPRMGRTEVTRAKPAIRAVASEDEAAVSSIEKIVRQSRHLEKRT